MENTKVKSKKKKTITQYMIKFFIDHPDAKFKDVPLKDIQKIKPDSAFNIYHFSWFKQQILKEDGRYNAKYVEMQGAKE